MSKLTNKYMGYRHFLLLLRTNFYKKEKIVLNDLQDTWKNMTDEEKKLVERYYVVIYKNRHEKIFDEQ